MWPDRRLLDLIGTEHPLLQAPMAGASTAELAVAVAEAGGLGSLACAMLTPDAARREIHAIRERTDKPLNLNFFCHNPPMPDEARQRAWRSRLRPFYLELGLDPEAEVAAANRAPFDARMAEVVEETRPEVVSFHFGLPEDKLLSRVRATGARILSSATTVAEARWLEARGVHAIVAQGLEAGGHRGMFLDDDPARQPGLFALLPQIADAVSVPVVAAGGISDGRGIAAAFALGAAGVQIGTAYLFCPECQISGAHREALAEARDDSTALTNVITGRPARGIVTRLMREVGPMSPDAPTFPTAAADVQPLRRAAEARGSGDFSPLWAGQAVGMGRALGAGTLTRELAADALRRLGCGG